MKKDNETINVNVHIISSEQVTDPILLVPSDEYHPITQAVKKDAMRLAIDYDKLGELKFKEEEAV